MKNNGFTIIELLVTIFIIAVLSSIAMINFGDIREELALRRTAHQLMQDLRKAQEMAVSPKASEKCPQARGYGIYVDIPSSNTNYKLYADTTNEGGEWEYYNTTDCVIETISIQEKGVIIKQILNTEGGVQKVSINYAPPNPNTKIKWIASNMDEVDIVLALEKNPSKTETVIVNKAGMIAVGI